MRILVLLAHPQLCKSRANCTLAQAVREIESVTINELYRHYPDFLIDVEREQKLLLAHDLIVFQHPFYWYSTPAILKEWQDAVLEYGFAYGEKGTQLRGKKLLSVITTGGTQDSYGHNSTHNYFVPDFLKCFEQTATLCGMNYEKPFLVHGADTVAESELKKHGERYRDLLLSYAKEAAL